MPITPKQAILNALKEATEAMTARDIAAACGRTKTTPFMRHIRSLVDIGLVTEIVPDASNNGRPAHLYRLNTQSNKGDLRRQWQQWCQSNFALDYVLWLEGVATGDIDPTSGG